MIVYPCIKRGFSVVLIALCFILVKDATAVPFNPEDPSLQFSADDFQNLTRDAPLSQDERLAEALELLNRGELDSAIKVVREFLQENPKSAPAREILGAALVMKGELDAGLTELKKAVKADARQSSAITKIGDVYLSQKRYKDAKREFLRAIKISPEDRRAHQRLAALYEREGNFKAAIEHYERGLIGTPPDYVGIKINLAILYNRFKGFDKTVRLLEKLITE
ncbi:MAG: tetratricopeptide repeat protein, partial [Deltaproteobacteria bacterium]|nr:tetratricopeptide repeat protein [Deltaproteobacteria bacterium]